MVDMRDIVASEHFRNPDGSFCRASEILKKRIMQVKLEVILNISNNNKTKTCQGLILGCCTKGFAMHFSWNPNSLRVLLLILPFF